MIEHANPPSTAGDSTAGDSTAFSPPALVGRWTSGAKCVQTINGVKVALSTGRDVTLATVVLEQVRSLAPGTFADNVALAYQAIEGAVATTEHAHIIRWWNGIPGVHDRVDAGRDRYMAFNAGRFAAMRRRYGDASLAAEAPAATGVGIDGDALFIHALAAAAPGQTMQNPRQRAAVRYSNRFGPLPPCFARATLATIGGSPTLFISGTASILGEETVHLGDLNAQVSLTLEHLHKMIARSCIVPVGNEFAAIGSLRAYLPGSSNVDAISARLREVVDSSVIDWMPAELCRRDLLVEIECIANATRLSAGAEVMERE